MRWTTEQDYALLERWERGDAWPLIATALGRPTTACRERLRRVQAQITSVRLLIHDTLQLEPRRFTRGEDAWLRRWQGEGLTVDLIAGQLGYPADAVSKRLAEIARPEDR